MSRRISLAEALPSDEPPAPTPATPASPEPDLARPAVYSVDAPGAEPLLELRRTETPAGPNRSADPQTPLWQRLERKELRLRTDQLEDLTRLTRRLNRSRAGQGERITENTLIRVAIDKLLSDAEALTGTTEAELWKSATP